MTVDPTKVTVECMVAKKFKKDEGYDGLMKKLYEKAKKAKAKSVYANIQYPNTKFTPGAKGKPPVPLIDNSKIKKVKKGPQADKVVVVATEGDAKKKTMVIALRFESQDGAKLFYDITKMKGVKPQTPLPAPPTPASATRSPTPESVRTPEHTYENTRSGDLVPTPQSSPRHEQSSRSMSRSESSRYSPTPSLQPVGRKSEMSERQITSITSPSTVKHTERTRTPSSSKTPDRRSRSQQQSRQNRLSFASSASSSSSSSYSRPMPPPADSRNSRKSKSRSPSRVSRQSYSSESRTTFVSTDPRDYMRNRNYQTSSSNVLASKGPRSKAYGSGDQKSRSRSRSPRKSAEPVRIFTLKPGRSPSHMDTGRMYYYTASHSMSSSSSSSSSISSSRHSRRNTRSSGSRRISLPYSSSSSSSSSRSSSTSTSSSESIATRWMRNGSAGRGRSSSKYAHRNRELVEVRRRPYSMGPGSLHHQRFLPTSSSSSSSSSSFSSSENVHARTWRIRRRTSPYSSTSSSSSSSSTISKKHHSSHKHRDSHSRVMRVITPR